MRRVMCNTLEWTPDSRDVVFGYHDGIAAVPAGGGTGLVVSRVLAVTIDALDPAPIYLVDAIVPKERLRDLEPGAQGTLSSGAVAPGDDGQPNLNPMDLAHPEVMMGRRATSGTYLLYPMARRWRVFTSSGLTRGRPRAASSTTVWWARGSTVHAIRAADPDRTEEVRTEGDVLWLGYDETSRTLAWAARREWGRRSEEGERTSTVVRARTSIRAVLPSRTGRRVGLVTSDSMLVWDPAGDAVQRLALGGLKPEALFEGPDGEVLVATSGGRRSPPGLARAGPGDGCLVALEVPEVRGGRFHPVGEGAWLLLYGAMPRPPESLFAYEVRARRWVVVENPGISGWEPLAPR
jgi:hypothetical protein